MNWLVMTLVGGAAVWFEYNYQRSRHAKKPESSSPKSPASTAANVEQAGEAPSISPGSENDKKLNQTA